MKREEEITKEAKKFAKEIDDWEIAEDVQDAFEQGAKWADKHPHWISVDEELPKEKGWIIVSTFFNSQACPAYYYEGEDVEEFRSQGITHWMPMPSLPSCSEKPNNLKEGGEE